MAYATGTGTGQQDFLDALRSFASGLGWTINRWDTTNKLLYLSKDHCKVVLEWLNTNISVYNNSTTSTTFSEGRIRGSLVSAITDSSTQYWTFPGFACLATTAGRDNGGQVYVGNMQGAFVGWHLFSNANGDYIHAMIEVTAGVYTFFGFGKADQGGMSHSGAAYLFGDGLRYWYDESSSAGSPENNTRHYFNKPYQTANLFGTSRRSPASPFQVFSVDALPAGFTNGVAIPEYSSTNYSASNQRAMPMLEYSTSLGHSNPNDYPSNTASGSALADDFVVSRMAEYSTYVPMIGIPLIVWNETRTQACCVGSVPDLRLCNLSGLSPQQELNLGDDVWKVFPQLRQTNWADSVVNLAPSSGQYGCAFKKIA